jgi:hypothetical protein
MAARSHDADGRVRDHPAHEGLPSSQVRHRRTAWKGSLVSIECASPDLGRLVPLSACSVCLRVLSDGRWIEADAIIHAQRSFEHPAPPRLGQALCSSCAEALRRQRVGASEPLAA